MCQCDDSSIDASTGTKHRESDYSLLRKLPYLNIGHNSTLSPGETTSDSGRIDSGSGRNDSGRTTGHWANNRTSGEQQDIGRTTGHRANNRTSGEQQDIGRNDRKSFSVEGYEDVFSFSFWSHKRHVLYFLNTLPVLPSFVLFGRMSRPLFHLPFLPPWCLSWIWSADRFWNDSQQTQSRANKTNRPTPSHQSRFRHGLVGATAASIFAAFPRALSICVEKPVVPVGNQMERAFPLEIFRKKRNTFRGIPLFSFLPKWSENRCSICCHPLVPCSLDEYADFCPKTWRLSFVASCLFPGSHTKE